MPPSSLPLIWRPQPKQHALIACPIEDILFGGARGGGKTDGLLGDWMAHANLYGEHARGLFLRKSYPELEEVEARCRELFPYVGAQWQATKRTWVWKSGATLRLRYLEREQDTDHFQGHQYCVAVGTGIVMADGSRKPIETIEAGEYVQTLEGTKRVTAVVTPYLTPCVAASLFAGDGSFVGVQVHPWRHPVLTTAGVHEKQWHHSRGKFGQFPHVINVLYTRDGVLHPGTDREILDWYAFAADDQTDYRVFGDEHLRRWQLPVSYVPVVLHAQTLQLALERRDAWYEASTQYYFPGKFPRPLWGSSPASLPTWLDHQPPDVLSQSIRLIDALQSASDQAYVPGAKHTWPNFLGDYPSGDGLYDVLVPASLGNALDDIQRRDGVAIPSHEHTWDVSDTTPRYTHHVLHTYTHPYSGEARCLSEEVVAGYMQMIPCGLSFVADLTIEDANHYISDIGVVNKNTWVGADEVGNYPTPLALDKIRACLRSPHGVPCYFRGSANPGGVGHNWLKARYIDPAPPMIPFATTDTIAGETITVKRCYIPATLDDNPMLITNDPQYWQRVVAAAGGNEALVKAWRLGLWDIVAGGYFDDLWNANIHILEPFDIPKTWRIRRAFDWGSSKPFSVGWWAHSDGGAPGPDGKKYPKGTRFRCMELYGWDGKHPNEGLRLTNTEIARRIKAVEDDSLYKGRLQPGPADSQIFDVVNGTSIADEMARVGIRWQVAQKGPGSRRQGWQLLRQMLKASTTWPMEEPGVFVFSTCRQFIRTFPVLPRDPTNADDVDSSSEDHIGDETRYECSMPFHESRVMELGF